METRLKTAEDFTIPKVYTLQKAEYVKELDSFALVLKHNLSGARILVFSRTAKISAKKTPTGTVSSI